MIILNILLWILRIIFAVLCLIVIAFAIPVRLEVGYSEKIKLTVKYLFLKFPIDLEKEKPKKPEKKKKKMKGRKKPAGKKSTKKKFSFKKTDKAEKISTKTDNTRDKEENKKEIPEENKKESRTKSASPEEKPKKKRKPKKEKKPKEKNKTLEKLKDIFKKHGLEGIIEIIKELAGISKGLLGCVFKHIVIVKLDLNIVVAFEDSYKTAVNYGYVCSGVYPGLAVILRAFKYKDYNVNITTDFDKKKPEIDVTADVSIVPWFVVIGGIQALIRFLKLKMKGLL